MESVHAAVEYLARALEFAGVGVILVGVLLASLWFLRDGRRGDWRDAYESYRANLGRGILLGLELLVGADIVMTITADLTPRGVALLAGIVLIRTFLSFALETEIEGCWPWQRARIRGEGTAAERR